MSERRVLGDLYFRHARGVRRLLVRFVGEGDADDLTHDVFEKAQRALGTHRAQSRLSTWLYRIATHVAIDRLRNRSVRGRDDAQATVPGFDMMVEDFRPDREVLRTQTRECILLLVDRLPASQKAVLVLSEMRGLSDREAADALGITLSSAKIRLHRARKQLRALMECECSVYRDERNELGCEHTRSPIASSRGRCPGPGRA